MSKTRQRLAKVRWGCLLGLFGCFSLVCGWFWRGGGHFRTARSGVYMGAGLTDSVIRFWFLVEREDAREEECFLLIVRGLTRANAIRSSREHD